ncbi:MAG: DUF3501 family protein [Acidobacteria bacterium]|nr:DUF3501 family protein [Acidobacteriota bacterium]
MAEKLTLDDIADLRAYERERDHFRHEVIALKKRRRVPVGPVVTLVFENRTTVRFQIQEMARAERMLTDDKILVELDAYNPLIPGPGQLMATMFLELTNQEELERWLPALVGVEATVELRLADGSVVPCSVDPAHAAQLTREQVTASVHYVGFDLTEAQIAAFAAGPVRLAVAHPAYQFATALSPETHAELLGDLRA